MPCLLRILFEHPSGGGTSGRGLSDGNGEELFLLFPMFMEGHTNKTRNTTFFKRWLFRFFIAFEQCRAAQFESLI